MQPNKSTIFIFIICLQFTFSAINLNEEAIVASKLKHYLNDIWKCESGNEAVILNDDCRSKVIDWFLTKIKAVLLAGRTGVQSVCEHIGSNINFFIFAASKEQVLEYIHLVNISYVHIPRFLIVICSEEQANEEDVLQYIWQTFHFLDCILITCHESVRAMIYNPFFNKTLALKKRHMKNCQLFPDKLKHMNGHKIKVALFPDPPRAVLHNGHVDGRDVRFMRLAFEKMNASADIVIPEKVHGSYFTGTNLAIVARKIDVSFMNHFSIRIVGKNESFSYPHKMDDFVVIMLKRAEIINYFNVHEIFDYYTWMCILICLFGVTIFRILVERRSDACSSFLYTWAVFTSNSLHSVFQTSKKVKFIFFVWIVGCLVLNIIFASLLASKIIKPRIGENIDKINQLRNLNAKILMSQKFIEAIPAKYGISKNLVATSHLQRVETLKNLNEKTAVVVASTVVELIRDRSSLHILKEHLLPGFSMYRFQSKSPYKKKINELLFKSVEHGLAKFNENFTMKHCHGHLKKKESFLTFVHLENIFLILAIGNTIAMIVFVLEILSAKVTHRNDNIHRPYLN